MIRIAFNPATLTDDERTYFEQWTIAASKALEAVAEQEHHDPESYARVYRDFKTWLGDHFFGSKCAYCEGPLGEQTKGAAEHWRPKRGVEQRSPDGSWHSVHHDTTGEKHRGYWWLAFAWENLVPGCTLCNENKGVRFPIRGRRVFDYGEATCMEEMDERERPLLLHPFRGEDPSAHIGFRQRGEAYALTETYGKATIDVCDLNRWRLVKARVKAQKAAANALGISCVETVTAQPTSDVSATMREWDSRSANYSQAVRAFLDGPERELLHQLELRREAREKEEDRR